MSGGGTNTVTSTTVPDWLQPYMTGALAQGQNLLQQPTSNMVAPFNPTQQAGFNSIAQTAGGVNPSLSAANANAFETSGALLNPSMNPYLKGTFTQAADAVQNQLGSEFAVNGSNVLNSLPVQSDEMNNLATQLYGGAYQSGLDTMTRASGLAPEIQAGTYLPSQELLNAGGQQQAQAQSVLSAPYNALSWYSGLLGQNSAPFLGGASHGSISNNPWSTAIGAGLLGTGLYESGLLGTIFGAGGGGGAAADAAGLMAAG